MADIFRRKQPGEAWETAVVSAGGGGTPGGSDGEVQYNNGGSFGAMSGFTVDDATGAVTISGSGGDGIYWEPDGLGSGKASFFVGGDYSVQADTNGVSIANVGMPLGFFGVNPVAKPTGVPVTAAGVHAALVTLGLISA